MMQDNVVLFSPRFIVQVSGTVITSRGDIGLPLLSVSVCALDIQLPV